jgi:hypothetical protein
LPLPEVLYEPYGLLALPLWLKLPVSTLPLVLLLWLP